MGYTRKGVAYIYLFTTYPQTMNNIESTYDYNLFDTFKFNRKTEKNVRPELLETFREFGNIIPILTVLSKKFNKQYIVDGQHRFKALKALRMPIHYLELVVPDDLIGKARKLYIARLIVVINNTPRRWSVLNYVTTFITLGFVNYKTLFDLADEYSFSLTTVSRLLTGSKLRTAASVKDGSFKVTALDQTLKILFDVAEYQHITKFTNRMVEGYATFFRSQPHIDKTKFKKALALNKGKLTDISEAPVFARAFEDFYNSVK